MRWCGRSASARSQPFGRFSPAGGDFRRAAFCWSPDSILALGIRLREFAHAEKAYALVAGLLQLAHEKQWFRDERFDLLPALAARRLRDRAVTEAIGQITQSPGIEQMALPEREPSEEDIQAEMKEIRFVERLWQTIPDLRNQLA